MKVIRIPAVYMNWIVHVRNICSLCKDLDEVEIDDLELLMNDEVDPQSAHWSSAIVHKSEKWVHPCLFAPVVCVALFPRPFDT